MIGCTILRAVSGILRTQRGRRGSGPGRQLAGALRLFYSPSRLNSRPVARLSAPVALLSPVAHHCLSSPPWLSSSPLWLNSLSPGRRRRLATSHWPWAYSLGCSPACQIKPDRIATVVVIGVQWGGLGLARFAGGLPTRRDLGGSGASGTGLCSCVFSWAVAGVADRQRHAASPVSGIPD